MEQKDIKRLIKALAAVGALLLIIFIAKPQDVNKDTILINTNDRSPVVLVGGGGERIYLKFGTIYGFKDDPKKEYRVVAITLHFTQSQLDRMVFFNTQKEAEMAGYKPSKSFQEDYNCVEQGLDLFECPERNSE